MAAHRGKKAVAQVLLQAEADTEAKNEVTARGSEEGREE